jgi:hypothetical protein
VDASLIDYDEAHAKPIYQAVKDRLRQVPGVQSVAMAATVPFGMINLGKSIAPSEVAVSKEHPALSVRYNVVSEDYFQTLGIPILRGRPFTAAESVEKGKKRRRGDRQVGGSETVAGRRCAGQTHPYRWPSER